MSSNVDEVLMDSGGPKPTITGIFIRRGNFTYTHTGEDHVKTETEVGVVHL